MKRAAVVVCAVLLLAACGGGGSGNAAEDQVKAAYTAFFSSKTSLADHVALVQDGPKFRSVIQGFLSNPAASGVSAKVLNVDMLGADKAQVQYSVKVSGLNLTRTGEAVRQGGKWKVAASTVCGLVSLAGPAPPVCKS